LAITPQFRIDITCATAHLQLVMWT